MSVKSKLNMDQMNIALDEIAKTHGADVADARKLLAHMIGSGMIEDNVLIHIIPEYHKTGIDLHIIPEVVSTSLTVH